MRNCRGTGRQGCRSASDLHYGGRPGRHEGARVDRLHRGTGKPTRREGLSPDSGVPAGCLPVRLRPPPPGDREAGEIGPVCRSASDFSRRQVLRNRPAPLISHEKPREPRRRWQTASDHERVREGQVEGLMTSKSARVPLMRNTLLGISCRADFDFRRIAWSVDVESERGRWQG
jgi:hypothetical protein